MVMPPPPISPGYPSANDITRGAKLDISDIAMLAIGGGTLTGEVPAAAIDIIQFNPCPRGVRRLVAVGYAIGIPGSILIWQVLHPDGNTTWICGSKACDYSGAPNFAYGANLKPTLLGEGDILQCVDLAAMGGTIDAGTGFIDVSFR